MSLTDNNIAALWIAAAIWIAVLFILPTFRARCHAALIAISRPGLRLRIYVEKTKYRGQLFGTTTCIALVSIDGSVYRVLYGTPNLFALHYTSLPAAADCYKIVAQRIKH